MYNLLVHWSYSLSCRYCGNTQFTHVHGFTMTSIFQAMDRLVCIMIHIFLKHRKTNTKVKYSVLWVSVVSLWLSYAEGGQTKPQSRPTAPDTVRAGNIDPPARVHRCDRRLIKCSDQYDNMHQMNDVLCSGCRGSRVGSCSVGLNILLQQPSPPERENSIKCGELPTEYCPLFQSDLVITSFRWVHSQSGEKTFFKHDDVIYNIIIKYLIKMELNNFLPRNVY